MGAPTPVREVAVSCVALALNNVQCPTTVSTVRSVAVFVLFCSMFATSYYLSHSQLMS